MSYSLLDNCWNCKNKDLCTDRDKIQNGIQDVHIESISDEKGHMGSGTIILFCCRHHKQTIVK